jgi:hypothetical protein
LLDDGAVNTSSLQHCRRVKYLGITFDKRITLRLHLEKIEAKAFRTFTRIYSLFKIECLSSSIKLTLYEALIRSAMSYAYPAWEFEVDSPS